MRKNFLLDTFDPEKERVLTGLADGMDKLDDRGVATAQSNARQFLRLGQPPKIASACRRILDYERGAG